MLYVARIKETYLKYVSESPVSKAFATPFFVGVTNFGHVFSNIDTVVGKTTA